MGSIPTISTMYICICCNITENDIEDNSELLNLVGSVCGTCIFEGDDKASTGLSKASGQLNKDKCKR